jgi:hypothetical protein
MVLSFPKSDMEGLVFIHGRFEDRTRNRWGKEPDRPAKAFEVNEFKK